MGSRDRNTTASQHARITINECNTPKSTHMCASMYELHTYVSNVCVYVQAYICPYIRVVTKFLEMCFGSSTHAFHFSFAIYYDLYRNFRNPQGGINMKLENL